MKSFILFLAHDGIAQPNYWNMYLENYHKSQKTPAPIAVSTSKVDEQKTLFGSSRGCKYNAPTNKCLFNPYSDVISPECKKNDAGICVLSGPTSQKQSSTTDHEIHFIVHSPKEKCPPGWTHISELGLKYQKKSAWCTSSLVTIQLNCYYHIIKHFFHGVDPEQMKGTVYLVSGNDIPCRPADHLVRLTTDQIDMDGIIDYGLNVQWASFTIKTIVDILEVSQRTLFDMHQEHSTFAETLAQTHIVRINHKPYYYEKDIQKYIDENPTNSVYDLMVEFRNRLANKFCESQQEILRYKNYQTSYADAFKLGIPALCPDNTFIATLLLLIGKKPSSMFPVFDPRGCTSLSPINFGHDSNDPLRTNYAQENNRLGSIEDQITVAHADYFKDMENEDTIIDLKNKFPVFFKDNVKIISFGLEMHVLAMLCIVKKNQNVNKRNPDIEEKGLFFRKVSASKKNHKGQLINDICESPFLLKIIQKHTYAAIVNALIVPNYFSYGILNSNEGIAREMFGNSIFVVAKNAHNLDKKVHGGMFTNMSFTEWEEGVPYIVAKRNFNSKIRRKYIPNFCREIKDENDGSSHSFEMQLYQTTKKGNLTTDSPYYISGGKYIKSYRSPKYIKGGKNKSPRAKASPKSARSPTKGRTKMRCKHINLL